MVSLEQLSTAQAALDAATVAYAWATAVVWRQLRAGAMPTRQDLKREEDAKASLETARYRFLEIYDRAD